MENLAGMVCCDVDEDLPAPPADLLSNNTASVYSSSHLLSHHQQQPTSVCFTYLLTYLITAPLHCTVLKTVIYYQLCGQHVVGVLMIWYGIVEFNVPLDTV